KPLIGGDRSLYLQGDGMAKPCDTVFPGDDASAILDDPMECSRGERLAITLAKDSINRSSNRSTTGKLEVDIFELLRDSEYEMGETMCQIMSKGVVAVLGPSASPASNSIISNICGEKE
ncbi:hypothetical protein NHX12_008309, partial [Muraenolepis orangiensis]